MRKTQNAVWALLLVSTIKAAATDPVYATATYTDSTYATAADAKAKQLLQGKPFPSLNPIYQSANTITPTSFIATLDKDIADAANDAVVVAGTKSCMDCIRGIANASAATPIGSVWCSAAWNYSYTLLPIATDYPHATRAVPAYDYSATGGKVDNATPQQGDWGSCCYTAAEINVQYDKTAGTAAGTTNLFNKVNCPARFTNGWIASGGTITFSAANWWCSDGAYQHVTTAASPVTTGFGNIAANFASGVGATMITTDKDRRYELFFAACRQKNSICGGSGWINDADTQSGNLIRTIASTGFTQSEKCTWAMSSITKAPTFKIYGATATTVLTNYDVIYQEWVDGWNTLAKGTDFEMRVIDTTNSHGGVLYPHMVATKYAQVAKYNYAGFETQGSGTLNDQGLGSAFVFVKTADDCAESTTPGTNAPSGCINDGIKVKQRWFNASEATSGLSYYNTAVTQFKDDKTAYESKATAYNAYLAALVTPPDVKPTQVMRPTTPKAPPAFSGLRHWSAASQTLFQSANPSTGFPVWGQEFIAANRLGEPGWGAWTISRIAGGYGSLATNQIYHSFGNVGVHWGPSTDEVMALGSSWVKQYYTAGAPVTPLTTVALKAAHDSAGQIMCVGATPAQNNKCVIVGTTAPVTNTKAVYLNISVWAAQAVAPSTTAMTDTFSVQFKASEWANDSVLYAQAIPAAATALTAEPAFAQALNASAFAIIAVAASLY